MLIESRSTLPTPAPLSYISTSTYSFRDLSSILIEEKVNQLSSLDPDDLFDEVDSFEDESLDDLFGESNLYDEDEDLYDEDEDDEDFYEEDDDYYDEDEYETEEYNEYEDEYKDEYDGGYGDDGDGYHQEIDFGSDALGLDRIDEEEEDEDDDDYF